MSTMDYPGRASPTLDDIKTELRQLVKARFYRFAERFAEIDYANIGVIAKEDFREVLNECAFRLSYEQVSSWLIGAWIQAGVQQARHP